jgi:TPR repeat protein
LSSISPWSTISLDKQADIAVQVHIQNLYKGAKIMRNNEKSQQEVTALLSKLQLWSSDPETAEEVRAFAEEGNRHAQYAMGLIYAEGRGVKQNNQQAYVWLSRAGQQGDEDARLLCDFVKLSMTSNEIQNAEKLLSTRGHH